MLAKRPVRQIAYFVPDIEAAATLHYQQYGSGPYFIAEHIELSKAEHRGAAVPLDHSSAYGQWGHIMIEFVQQNNPEPSVFRDLYPDSNGQGLHHLAIFVDNLQKAMMEYNAYGFETALYAETHGGTAFAMIDMIDAAGHFLELYEPSETLVRFYDVVKDAARNFDGNNPLRHL